MGKTGRHKRGILPKHLRPVIQRKRKPKTTKQLIKEVQEMIYQLEYRRATLPKVNNQRRALVECVFTNKINQGRKLLEDLEKRKETEEEKKKKESPPVMLSTPFNVIKKVGKKKNGKKKSS